MKSDVKPVVSSASNAVLFTGATRLRGYAVQSTGNSGVVKINGLADASTVSSSTNTEVFIPVRVAVGQTETLNLPEDGVLYATRSGTGIINGIGITGNTAGHTVILFIDK
jgi:hypothetical protein